MGRGISKVAIDSRTRRGSTRKTGTLDLSAFLSQASQVLGSLQNAEATAGQINEAANLAVAAINGAKETAKGEIEGKKKAAIQAIERAKPNLPSRNTAVEESDNHPVPQYG